MILCFKDLLRIFGAKKYCNMKLFALKSSENYEDKVEKLSKGEYVEVSYNRELLAEFEYFDNKGMFIGCDYTEDFDYGENHFIADLQDEYRINDFFKPTILLDMLEEWKEKFPQLSITGRTLLEERLDDGTI